MKSQIKFLTNVLFVWSKQDNTHKIKEGVILNHKKERNINILVESGTFLGEMVWKMRKHFEKIYSIELSDTLYNNAIKNFKFNKNIFLLKGDSGIVIGSLLTNITESAIFWLDGHYSGGDTARSDNDSPVKNEIRHILEHKCKKHIILLDDANLFNGDNGYPKVNEIEDMISEKGKFYKVSINKNIIEILPL